MSWTANVMIGLADKTLALISSPIVLVSISLLFFIAIMYPLVKAYYDRRKFERGES